MRTRIPSVAIICCLASLNNLALAQTQRITKTFENQPARSERLDACAAAKRDAQSWVANETKKVLATTISEGRMWTAELDGYSQCDCEKNQSVTGLEWRCSIDATIRERK